MTEIWRPVVGREGFYEVSDCGSVRSLDRTIFYNQQGKRVSKFFAGQMIAPKTQPSGHLQVGLGRLNGCRLFKEIQVIVLEAFVGPRPYGQANYRTNRSRPKMEVHVIQTPKADALRALRERRMADHEAKQKRLARAVKAVRKIENQSKPKRRRSRPGSTEPG